MQFGDIVILTGAGISKESGIDTFRDRDGIWSKVNMEDVATPEGYARDPKYVLDFHNQCRRDLRGGNIRPNAAHEALSRLEQAWPGEVLLVTQNVDDLHTRAGSKNLIQMHGEMFRMRCEQCGDVHDCAEDTSLETVCPGCSEAGGVRPHVVWFGEMPFRMEEIQSALSRCRLFMSIGTSGVVYPAAGFVQEAIFRARAHTVELNLEPSEGASLFAEQHYGPATEVVPVFVDKLLAGQAAF